MLRSMYSVVGCSGKRYFISKGTFDLVPCMGNGIDDLLTVSVDNHRTFPCQLAEKDSDCNSVDDQPFQWFV